MRIAESELIINADGSAFHIHLRPEELADNVILVGDPGRVAMVSEFLTDIEFRHESREFVSVTGKYNGKRVTVLSTGIGTDNIDIVMNELDALANIDFKTREVKKEHRTLTVLRIGTCGAVQPDIPIGSYIFSHISVGCDGLLNWYADREKISLMDMEEAFKKHVGWNKYLASPYFVRASQKLIDKFKDVTVKGVTISAGGFYGPQGRVLRLPLAMPDMVSKFESFKYGEYRITNFEMEGSALAGICAHLGHDAGTVCCAIANRHIGSSNPDYKALVRGLVKLCLDKLTE
ncbi:MAG: nucleoside phosphorylase [Bacteroidales bacterium]|jgi:uridine phosphorylase|nr:nucleoside phosphorylase [Bacteroidales bacterium]MBQ2091191.1 nucleoside phosphorylase [Bacteroidales bacterium]MBQ7468341.1 nucleoside phosphorylase [Bacteroidales bacterium]MBQ8461234.1 nucleoside phosphorylase [Bacteroidales bacterium]